MESPNKAIVILGMHRTGTSVLSACLKIMGVHFGQSLTQPNLSNQSDFFDNKDLVLIHDLLLRDLGCQWSMIGSLPAGWLESEAANAAKERIIKLLERDFSEKVLWAIKDPRLCRIMPLWLDVFETKNIDPLFVFLVRHPYEVAKSLKKRDGFDLLKGHLLWLTHNREALLVCSNHRHVISTYDQLLADPASVLETIRQGLGISFAKGLQQGYQELIALVRPDLKHQHAPSYDPNGGEIFAEYATLYERLRLAQTKALQPTVSKDDEMVNSSHDQESAQMLAAFPLVAGNTKVLGDPEESYATKMFDDLLNMISRYEQAELDLSQRRQRLLINAAYAGDLLYAQVFFPVTQDGKTYTEGDSQKILLAPEEWQKISVDLPYPEHLRRSQLRFVPLNTKGMVRIQSLSLVEASTEVTVWSASSGSDFDQCLVPGQALVLDRREGLLICSTGTDNCILLPVLPHIPDVPLRFEAWVKASRGQTEMLTIWDEKEKQIRSLKKQLKELKTIQKQADAKLADVKNARKKDSTIWNQAKNDFIQQMKEQKRSWETKEKNLLGQIEGKRKEIEEWRQHKSKWLSENDTLKKELRERKKLLRKWRQREKIWNEKQKGLHDSLVKQEDLSKQYLNELAENEREWKQREKISNEEQELLHDNLSRQKELSRQYFNELAESERQLNRTRETNSELSSMFQQLNQNFQTLLGSVRWRTGNRNARSIEISLFRKKQPLAVEHMHEIFSRFEQLNITESIVHSSRNLPSGSLPEKYAQQLIVWLRKLKNDFLSLRKSWRWRVGNLCIRSLEVLILRPKKSMAIDHLQSIFTQFNACSNKMEQVGCDVQRLEKWIRQVGNDLQALLASKRWKTGDRIFSIIDILLFRGNREKSVDHMQKILSEFKNWQKAQNE